MDAPDIPAEVLAALQRGRASYLAQDYATAERADGEALGLAEQLGSAAGATRAARLLGLCAYRRGESERSAKLLEGARQRAQEIGWEAEELLVCNHLGATYRKLGRLEEADTVFREALRRADPRRHLEARARLTGNYGAFLDDLGDERAAAEYYARYEELLGLLDDPGRLANAHGLVSRAARMRGDVGLAEAKALEERRLGALSGQRTREGRGWMHLAQACAASGRHDEAEEAFRQADELLTSPGDARAPIEIASARGRFLLGVGRLHEAYEQVGRARAALDGLSGGEHEHRARVSLLAAEVAGQAGLHGEALWHLANALESQLIRFDPISDPRLLRFTAGRRTALADLAQRVLDEAGVVDRAPEERTRVEELRRRLTVDLPVTAPAAPEPVERWRLRVRSEAERRWERLLPGTFATLSPASRGDLVLGDVVSQGPVGDLSRSLFLLFATIERELRERVFEPVRTAVRPVSGRGKPSILNGLVSGGRPFGLGDMVDALLQPPAGFGPDDPRVRLDGRLKIEFHGLGRLRETVLRVDGGALPTPLRHRNDIAHGRPWEGDRTDADAVRRVLTLGAEATLGGVLGIELG